MDAFEAEQLKHQVQDFLSESASPRRKLIILRSYYKILIEDSPKLIAKAYINEFLEEFIISIKNYEVFYFKPQLTADLLELLNKIKQFQIAQKTIDSIDEVSNAIKIKLDQLNSVLDGNELIIGDHQNLYFPLLEKENQQQIYSIGTLETLTIDIKKNSIEDTFIIIPSSEIIDELLLKQIKISWQIAIDFIKRHIRILNKYHKVIIHFDHRWGNYSGSSLGAALTITFIEELIKFYNLSFIISIKNNIALTGGFDEKGILNKLDEIIIEKKLETVFYSFIKMFIVPEENKIYVQKKLDDLKEHYPNRDLQIIGITDLQDLLNRRNLIDIKRQNPVVRTTKYARKNWVVTILILIILLLSGYFYEFNFDDNPAILHNTGRTLFLENKKGRVLWTKELIYNFDDYTFPIYPPQFEIITDINHDMKNEVILTGELEKNKPTSMKYIFCYNYLGKKLWQYKFEDSIRTKSEILSTNYGQMFIDTATIDNKLNLIAISQNDDSFSSAIYRLDCLTGKRIGTTLWQGGFFCQGLIKKFPNDQHRMLIFISNNNGLEKIAVGGIYLKDLEGQTPSTPYYTYLNIKKAKLKFYITFDKTDYLKYLKIYRTESFQIGSLYDIPSEKTIKFTLYNGAYTNSAMITYSMNYNFKDFECTITDPYRVIRDTLVAHGKLLPPLTDTPEYRKLLEDQILFWNGKKFVKKDCE